MKLSGSWLSRITINYIAPLLKIPRGQNPNHLDAHVLSQTSLYLCHQSLTVWPILTAKPVVDAHIQVPAPAINLSILLEEPTSAHVYKKAANQQIYLEMI
jgi:hypothetical protein